MSVLEVTSAMKRRQRLLVDVKRALRIIRMTPLAMIGTTLISALIVLAIVGPVISPSDPLKPYPFNRLKEPAAGHELGTDQLGRDILARILHGTRISLMIGLLVVGISGPLGIFIGLLSGYYGGKVDEIFMRISDMFIAFPALILAMAVASALGKGIFNAMIAIVIVAWPIYARLARAGALQAKQELYIEASRAIGTPNMKIIFWEVLPMLSSPLIVQATLDMGRVILIAAGLGFLGLGASPPTPEWGLMIGEGRQYILSEWWVPTFPGLAILFAALGFNLLGDSLRDIFDVRLTGKK